MILNSNNVLLLNYKMSYFMQIEYLAHTSIDKTKWDHSLQSSSNGLLYACSWYLDCVSPGWDALVANDYQFIFPVTVKRRYKLPYIVQPALAQQLGLFGPVKPGEELLQEFLSKIRSYSYEINLNFANESTDNIEMTNLVISLQQEYSAIPSLYSSNTRRNLLKAKHYNYTLSEQTPDEFLTIYHSVEHRDKSINRELISKLIRTGYEKQSIFCCGLTNALGETDAALAYGSFNGRITYLFPVSTEQGKQRSVMFMLVDELLRKYAGKAEYFDFEGSMIEGIARFYKGFGANNQPYRILKHMRPSFLVGKI